MKLVIERQHEAAMVGGLSHPSSLNRLWGLLWVRAEQFCFDLALQRYRKARSKRLPAYRCGANSEVWLSEVWR
jgi:hypothetical protein